MGKRSTSRRLAMQILYQYDMGQQDIDSVVSLASQSESFLEETLEFANFLVLGVLDNLAEIDKLIVEKSIGWSIERITLVDKAILRLAIYEAKFLKTPPSVVINEAVNLAKKFSTDDSSKFVNGILGNLES